MAISPQRLTIYLYSAHRAVIFAIAQLSLVIFHWDNFLQGCIFGHMRHYSQFKGVGGMVPSGPV